MWQHYKKTALEQLQTASLPDSGLESQLLLFAFYWLSCLTLLWKQHKFCWGFLIHWKQLGLWEEWDQSDSFNIQLNYEDVIPSPFGVLRCLFFFAFT